MRNVFHLLALLSATLFIYSLVHLARKFSAPLSMCLKGSLAICALIKSYIVAK